MFGVTEPVYRLKQAHCCTHRVDYIFCCNITLNIVGWLWAYNHPGNIHFHHKNIIFTGSTQILFDLILKTKSVLHSICTYHTLLTIQLHQFSTFSGNRIWFTLCGNCWDAIPWKSIVKSHKRPKFCWFGTFCFVPPMFWWYRSNI